MERRSWRPFSGSRLRWVVAVIASVVMVIAGMQPAQSAQAAAVAAATPAADPPAWSPVLANAQAQSAWGYLEDNATSLLAAHGLSADTSEQYARSLIRAYIFTQLVSIVNDAAAGDTLDSADQVALTYLEQQVDQERHWTALDAYAKYENYAKAQGCTEGTGPQYTDGSYGMGGVACVFTQMFGNSTPEGAAFNAAGFSEATQAFEDPAAATVFFDTAHSLSWWSNLNVTTGETADQVSLQEQAAQVLHDELTEAAREGLQEIGSALAEAAVGDSGAASWALAAAALAVIAVSGFWNLSNSEDTANSLEHNARNTPDVSNDLAQLTSSSGEAELLYVVLAQTLPGGQAIPSDASDALPPGPTQDGTTINEDGNFPCSFDPAATYSLENSGGTGEDGYSGCYGYTFASDPDYVAARYPSSAAPPSHTATDPDFFLTQQATSSNPSPTTTVSPALQNSDALLVPWVASDANGFPLVYDKSSARNISSDADKLSECTAAEGCSNEDDGYDSSLGYSSYIHNNMFVTQFGPENPPGGTLADPSTWQYNQGIRYVDWQGNWWIAWYRDGTFFHVKMAEPVGPMTPSTAVQNGGAGPCVENPQVTGFPYTSLYQTYGPDCLFSGNASTVGNLGPGDAVLVDGQVRVVDKEVECYFMQDVLFGVYTYCGNSADNTGNGFAANAIHLQPGISTNWNAWESGMQFLGSLVGLPQNPFSFGAKDNYAMKLVQADLSNCGTTDASDCYTSPTIDYKASVQGAGIQNWSATLTYPPAVTASSASTQEGTPFSGTVGTFTSSDPNAAASQFSASVDWGDGTSSAGTVTAASGGGFTVTASHDKTDEASYQTTVTVTDNNDGLSSTSNGTFTISDAPLTVAGANLSSTEGQALSKVTVGTFTDANADSNTSDFTSGDGKVIVDWGDGTISGGILTQTGPGQFSVTGSHTYADEGTYPVKVTVDDDGGQSATASGTATVSDAQLAATAATVSATEGQALAKATVATFTDANPDATPSDFTSGGGSVTIDWGDGNTSAGTVTQTGTGQFSVTGSHTYTDEGTYPVKVTVNDTGGQSATASGTALVSDAALTATAATVKATEGQAFSKTTVATFTDANPGATTADFTSGGGSVIVDWGDGNTSAGTVTQTGTGQFSVTGGHTYTDEGSYPVTVYITDTGGAVATTSGTAVVSDAALAATAATVSATEGQAFAKTTVATFTDANPGATTADFTSGGGSVTIGWGDGTTSAGTVTQTGTGQFSVTGNHTYTDEGSYPVTVTITDTGGAVATASGTAVVSDAALAATAGTVKATEGQALAKTTVATFTDANPGATTADFTSGNGSVTINWGDGTTSAGTVTQTGTGQFTVSGGNHTYTDEGSYPVTVTITDTGGSVATASGTAVVSDAPLTATGTTAFASTNPVSGTVATISDANPGATTADFTSGGGSVTVNWGDGTTSAGTVTQTGPGQFTVSGGSHTYAALGPHTVTVSVVDDGGSTATATTQVMIFAYLKVGGFVIGDGNDATGTAVTFWGPQWASDNSLSKTANPPPSFKGFEDSTSAPVCGTTWATDPGNSTPPPAGPLPSYMGVLVSSHVTASGSGPVISGDTPHIVVVKTNTGYNPAVGHTGTGTVVFRAC